MFALVEGSGPVDSGIERTARRLLLTFSIESTTSATNMNGSI